MSTKRKLIASDIVYIDPLDCGSTIGYAITTGRGGVRGTINLSDCNRQIEWYFDKNSSSDKIDKAISILQNFKRTLEAAKRKNKS